MNVNLDIEAIRELANNQYQKFNELNKRLFDMLLTEEVKDVWEENYHLIDHDWIIKWKETISSDDLDKKDSDEVKKSISNTIQETTKSNYIKNLNKIGIYCLKDNNKDPMKAFDIISDEVWKLFNITNENDSYSGKVSLLKGNRKILIRLDENIYYIKYLTGSDKILFGEFFITFNSKDNEEKKLIIKDIAKSDIYEWMKKNNFNSKEKEFTVNKYKIAFDIKQKTNNYSDSNVSSNINRDCYKDAYKYASSSIASYSFTNSFFNNNSDDNFISSIGFSNFFFEFQNFRIIQKYDKTTNVCSIMRCLSLIRPFADYFTSRIQELKIFSYFQSESLLNLIKAFLINLFENTKAPYAPKDFTKYIQNKAKINIEKEQDPFIFLDKILIYINKRLNKIDSDIDFHFNDILAKINNKLYEELYNDLENIFNKNRSVIGRLFLGIILETYKCDKCDKIIEKKNPFNFLDIDYKGIINELLYVGNSIVGFNIDNLLEFYFLGKKIENMEKPIIDCPQCGNKLIIIGRKIIDYPEYLIIRLNRGKFNEKDGFEEKKSFAIDYENIENLEDYSSEKIINEKINYKKYSLIDMVNFYEDKEYNDIRFLSICKTPYCPKDVEIWIKFKCNESPQQLKGGYKEDDESDPYLLFYKLEKKEEKKKKK